MLGSALLAPRSGLFAHTDGSPDIRVLQTPSDDEGYWKVVRNFFSPEQEKYTNLENGYFSAQPLSTLSAFKNNVSKLNQLNSFYMRNKQSEALKEVKEELSRFSGIPVEEFVICRNTTEALDTIIHGYPWQKGDEVVLSHQDYGSMQAAFKQEAKRHGIVLKYIELPLNPVSDEEVLSVYEAALSSRTKLVLLTHLINLSGQILPVKRLTKMVHDHGAEVMLDAAHSFAHIQLTVKDLDVDYMGTSLHKWLCCPLGLGLMYMKQEKISKIWPLFGDDEYAEDDIRKFEHHGTRPVSAISTIPKAIEFHKAIGAQRKENRLRYLKEYWLRRTEGLKGLVSNTPKDPARSCAIANFAIEGMTPNELAASLLEEHQIFTVAINSKEVNGVRVTPHLYTSLEELDQLVTAINSLCS